MKIQPIPLSSTQPNHTSTVHNVALATFTFLRKIGAKAAEVPDALQECARDIATAWAESRPNQ